MFDSLVEIGNGVFIAGRGQIEEERRRKKMQPLERRASERKRRKAAGPGEVAVTADAWRKVSGCVFEKLSGTGQLTVERVGSAELLYGYGKETRG